MMKTMQRLGRSLMLPISVMPAAAILMGIGYAIDHEGWGGNNGFAAFLITAGAAIIDSIPILFAVGISFGMSKDQNGAAALAGLVSFLVVKNLLSPGAVSNIGLLGELSEIQNAAFGRINNAFIGILSGCVAFNVYNKFHKTELPTFLAFFSGRRLVPIMVSGIMCVVAVILMFIWPVVFGWLVAFGEAMTRLGAFGAALYGFFNRLLIPIGMHHPLNAVFWFDLAGINDLGNFWGGTGVVGETGRYMAGFFPVMMFGLPGACVAMWRAAKERNRKIVLGLMMSAAFASFFTGVTEPIEFSFMFVAPVLYVVHAVLTGISMFIAASFQWFAGFGFSAGLIDMVLSTSIQYATQWYMLLVLGIVYFFVYFIIFSVLIRALDLKTPGREDDEDMEAEMGVTLDSSDYATVASTLIEGLGGKDNITSMEYCATRVRCEVKDYLAVDEKKIKSAGVAGVIRPSKTSVQVIVGTKVQFVADEMESQLK